MAKESDTESCSRPVIDWRHPEFLNEANLDKELRRVFDICHSCRRCSMLCDSFPRLFDLIDNAGNGTLDSVKSGNFKSVVDACTICDMCYPVCPYVSPHVYAVDFPNLMVRYRALERSKGKVSFFGGEFRKTDRNGRLLGSVAPLANWALSRTNNLTRPIMEWVAGVHRDAALPRYESHSFSKRSTVSRPIVDHHGPTAGRKAVIYATCFVEYNSPQIGAAAQGVLAKNGIATDIVYPTCCGMPQLEEGNIEDVCRRAKAIAAELCGWIDKGYDIITLIPSCALMMKSTWPLYLPSDPDIERLASNTSDICEFIVALSRENGLAEGLKSIDGDVTLHHACHARAQNVGPKSAVMLRMIPECNVMVTQRCSGHGGTWGVLKSNFDVGVKVGESVMKQVALSGRRYLSSECPLAGEHIAQGMQTFVDVGTNAAKQSYHPIELFAMSYGIEL